MRRVDIIAIGLGLFVAGGLTFGVFRLTGADPTNAGIWTQALLVAGLVIWILTYALRAVSGNMTYQQQRREYDDAVLQKRLDELTPEQLAQLQAEIEQEKSASNNSLSS
jgi:parvulin-like peptidyl-prolyl isomerase